MPDYQITLDSDCYKALCNLIDARLTRMSENVSAYVEYIIVYERIAEALDAAERITDKPLDAPAAKIKKAAPKKAAAPEKVVDLHNLCTTHPKYGARRSPRTDCKACWDAYEKYNGPGQAAVARRAFERKYLSGNGEEESNPRPSSEAASRRNRHNSEDLPEVETVPKSRNTRAQRSGASRKTR